MFHWFSVSLWLQFILYKLLLRDLICSTFPTYGSQKTRFTPVDWVGLLDFDNSPKPINIHTHTYTSCTTHRFDPDRAGWPHELGSSNNSMYVRPKSKPDVLHCPTPTSSTSRKKLKRLNGQTLTVRGIAQRLMSNTMIHISNLPRRMTLHTAESFWSYSTLKTTYKQVWIRNSFPGVGNCVGLPCYYPAMKSLITQVTRTEHTLTHLNTAPWFPCDVLILLSCSAKYQETIPFPRLLAITTTATGLNCQTAVSVQDVVHAVTWQVLFKNS